MLASLTNEKREDTASPNRRDTDTHIIFSGRWVREIFRKGSDVVVVYPPPKGGIDHHRPFPTVKGAIFVEGGLG